MNLPAVAFVLVGVAELIVAGPLGRALVRFAGRWWWVDIGALVGVYLSGSFLPPAVWLVLTWPASFDFDSAWIWAGGVFVAAAAGLATVVFAIRAGLDVGNARPTAGAVAVGVAVGLVSALLSVGFVLIAALLGAPTVEQGVAQASLDQDLPSWVRWGAAALTVGVVPVVEEAIFRGVVYGILSRRFGAPAALTLTAVAFGVFHGSEPAVLASTLSFGVAWGYLRALTGSIWPGVAAHATNNALALATGLIA